MIAKKIDVDVLLAEAEKMRALNEATKLKLEEKRLDIEMDRLRHDNQERDESRKFQLEQMKTMMVMQNSFLSRISGFGTPEKK